MGVGWEPTKNLGDAGHEWTGLDWFFLIPEGRRPKPATALHAMFFCPEQFSSLYVIQQRRKLRYFGHVVRADNICTSILHGRIAGTRKRGKP